MPKKLVLHIKQQRRLIRRARINHLFILRKALWTLKAKRKTEKVTKALKEGNECN